MRQIALGAYADGVETRILALSNQQDPKPAHDKEAEPEVTWCCQDFEVAGCGFSVEALRRFRDLTSWADVVHYHFPWPFADILHLVGRPNRPALVTYHSDIVKQEKLVMVYRPLMHSFLNSVQTIVATSSPYLQTSPVLQRFVGKTEVIPLGIDPGSYPEVDAERVAQWRDRLGDDFFLFIGVLRYYKGLHTLLDAVHGTSLKVAIVGGGPNAAEFHALASDKELKQVNFLGELPDEDKVALLSLCIGLVLPSHLRSEAFGIALLEAMMYGKPVISCELGTGTSYVNLHRQTGLVVPPNDASALREAMKYFVESPEKRIAWGKSAKERFERNFTADLMAKRYVELYRELASRESAARWTRSSRRKDKAAVAIFGAGSQIGQPLMQRLLARDVDVYALSRNMETANRVSGVIWRKVDVTRQIVPIGDAQCLIHLAPINLLPPMLEQLRDSDIRHIISFSSTSRFSKLESGDPKERATALDFTRAEEGVIDICERYGIAWTILRPTLIYGFGRDKNVAMIGRFIRRFGFFPLIDGGRGLRQPVHADDLAAACVAILNNPAAFNRAYDLSGGETLTYRAMVERIFKTEGKTPRFSEIPLALYRAGMKVVSWWPGYRHLTGEMARRMAMDLCFDHSEATRDFGYAPRPFEPPPLSR